MMTRALMIRSILMQLKRIFMQLQEMVPDINDSISTILKFEFAGTLSDPEQILALWNLIGDCKDAVCAIQVLRDASGLTEETIRAIQQGLLNSLDELEYTGIPDWNTLEILFTMPDRFRSFSFKFGDEVITLPWVWVRNGELIPADTVCLEEHAPGKKHPAQLTGWPLANYMNCVMLKREMIFRELTNETDEMFWQNIDETEMMYCLPDLNPSVYIQSIDPLDPLSIESYKR